MREWLSGGVSPCQGEGRGFESRLALNRKDGYEVIIFFYVRYIEYSNRRLRRFGAGFGLQSKHFPIRIHAHPRGAFISVRDWILTEISLLLLTIYRGESIL